MRLQSWKCLICDGKWRFCKKLVSEYRVLYEPPWRETGWQFTASSQLILWRAMFSGAVDFLVLMHWCGLPGCAPASLEFVALDFRLEFPKCWALAPASFELGRFFRNHLSIWTSSQDGMTWSSTAMEQKSGRCVGQCGAVGPVWVRWGGWGLYTRVTSRNRSFSEER